MAHGDRNHDEPGHLHFRIGLRRLLAASGQAKPRLFVEYCRDVIEARKRGELSLEDAGYFIAETMFIKELDEPLFGDITGVAGGLELPGHVLGVNPDDQWELLLELVGQYADRLRNAGEPSSEADAGRRRN